METIKKNNNIDYSQSKIYKLVDSNANNKLLYIGSCAQTDISKRLYQHKQKIKYEKHSKNVLEYFKSNDVNGLKIIIIKYVNVKNKNEL